MGTENDPLPNEELERIRAILNGAPLVFAVMMDCDDYIDMYTDFCNKLLAEVDRLRAKLNEPKP